MINVQQEQVAYRTLCQGAVVEVKLPKVLMSGSITAEDGAVSPYLYWKMASGGAVVDFFVHTFDRRLAGKIISARVDILEGSSDSSESKLLVNIFPLQSGIATDKLVVLDGTFVLEEDWTIYTVPDKEYYVALVNKMERLVQKRKKTKGVRNGNTRQHG